MRFYIEHHQFYCGIDLHARQMYLCVLDEAGKIVLHRNLPAGPGELSGAIEPYVGHDLVIAVECVFTWYWIGDFCAERNIPFVLAHALYIKAIHGAKTKNDKIDSRKIAMLLRAGVLPQAYVYPAEMRSTRDLLRRREYFMHQHSELLAHIENTNTQYNFHPFEKSIVHRSNRSGIVERFADEMVATSVEADMQLLDVYHQILLGLEARVLKQARVHDPVALQLLRSIPGVGKVLALVILYEIHDISRFPSVGQFISYARLVKCPHESGGKRFGGKGNKIGNAHLKWAFSEAAVLFLRRNEAAQRYHQKLVSRYGKAKAMSIIAKKLGRVVYTMLKKRQPFDPKKFYSEAAHESVA
jgi:transposase